MNDGKIVARQESIGDRARTPGQKQHVVWFRTANETEFKLARKQVQTGGKFVAETVGPVLETEFFGVRTNEAPAKTNRRQERLRVFNQAVEVTWPIEGHVEAMDHHHGVQIE